jgi:hypothetical protein
MSVQSVIKTAFGVAWRLNGCAHIDVVKVTEGAGSPFPIYASANNAAGIAQSQTTVSGGTGIRAIVRRVTDQEIQLGGGIVNKDDHKFVFFRPFALDERTKITWNSMSWEIKKIVSEMSGGYTSVIAGSGGQ